MRTPSGSPYFNMAVLATGYNLNKIIGLPYRNWQYAKFFLVCLTVLAMMIIYKQR